MTKEELIDIVRVQKEQSQQDILCILDGLDNEALDNVCQVLVDRFNFIIYLLGKDKGVIK